MPPLKIFESVVAFGMGAFVDLLLLGVFTLIVLFILGSLKTAPRK